MRDRPAGNRRRISHWRCILRQRPIGSNCLSDRDSILALAATSRSSTIVLGGQRARKRSLELIHATRRSALPSHEITEGDTFSDVPPMNALAGIASE